MSKKKKWYDYLWIVSIIYLTMGFFNIFFAWLGLIFFVAPLWFAIFRGNKGYCNCYCDRGQFLELLGNRLKISQNRNIPAWLRSKWFRYGFLAFFMLMFMNMLLTTYFVYSGAKSLKEVVTLFWTFQLPWHFAYPTNTSAPWIAQFAFGFYSIMLTSTILGIITAVLFKPRSWCVYCPMGTMTQLICKLKNK